MNLIINFILVLAVFNIFAMPTLAQEIHQAARQGDLAKIKSLLEKNSELVNAKDNRNFTPLHFAVHGKHKNLVKFLISKGAEINAKDVDGDTPIHWAAYAGSEDLAELLINKGADRNARNNRGWTSLHWAARRGHKQMADFLIKKGLEVNAKGNNGLTPLHLAAYHGYTEIVEFLIVKKTDVNLKDDNGDAPIHGAAWGGFKNVVELLIANGANVNVNNKEDRTPLDNANLVGRQEMVELLIAKGAISSSNKIKESKSFSIPKTTNIGEKKLLKITILYDNYVFTEGTKSDWGFSCLIEGMEKSILFDTGTKPEILSHNINKLQVDLSKVEQIVISHNHGDHTGGLFSVLEQNHEVSVYLPYSFPYDFVRKVEKNNAEVIAVNESQEICESVFVTGEMGDRTKEQSLILNTSKGLIVITGCSHPGIVDILKKAKEILDRNIYLVFGGFHLLRHSDDEVKAIIQEFRNLGVLKCGATHCTGDKAIQLFKEAYGENYVELGTGRVLEIVQHR